MYIIQQVGLLISEMSSSNLASCANGRADGKSPEAESAKGRYLVTGMCCFCHCFGMSCSSGFQSESSAKISDRWRVVVVISNVTL